ncbi:MAG: RidA family protein [Pseudomonadota bacterium]
MPRKLISSGSPFEEVAQYSRAVADGKWVFVSGTAGFDYKTMTISDDIVAQTEQAFRNIAAALEQAGSSMADVVRVVAFLASAEEFKRAAPIFGKWFKGIRPANTTVICALVDPRMKIEIEVTARKRG